MRMLLSSLLLLSVLAPACGTNDASDGPPRQARDDRSAQRGNLEEFDPCGARNPITLSEFSVVGSSEGNSESHEFDAAVETHMCVSIAVPEGMGQYISEAHLALDGEVIFDVRAFNGGGGVVAVALRQGRHLFEVYVESEYGLDIQVTGHVAGPVIDRISPISAHEQEILTIEGEGFVSPLRIMSGDTELQEPTAQEFTVATAIAVPNLYIESITVATPFGVTVSSAPYIPRNPPNLATIYDRILYPDKTGDGQPDIETASVVDDGEDIAIIVDFAGALPVSRQVTFEIQTHGAAFVTKTYAAGPTSFTPFPDGSSVVVGNTSVAFVAPLPVVGTLDPEGLGYFSYHVTITHPGGSDRFPDAGKHESRPLIAPRYLRYRAVDPAAVAANHGARYIATVENTDLSILEISPYKTLTQALADMVVDPDAIGAFVEPMGYADYAPTKADAILGPAESPGASFPPATCSNGSIVDTGTIGVRQWYMDSIGAAQAWANSAAGSPRGAGVKTIVADTGVGAHEDFLGGGRDLTRARNLLLPLTTDGLTDNDPHGHGTSVGGLIAAQANNGGIIGVAPDSQVVPFRVIYRNGSTIGFSVARALTVAMATQGRDPSVRIINLSLAEPIFATNMAGGLIASLGTLNPSWMIPAMATYLTEVELAKRAARRLLVVASAGNTGGTFLEFYGSTFPATVDGVLSVGALDTDGRAKLFSSTSPWGTTPDPTVAIAAPGNSLAAPETGMYSGRLTDLTCFGGTSGAAPIAAAGGAVLMSIPSRAFTPSQVRGHLVSSAIPTGDSVGLVGAGAMNLESAVNHAIAAPGRYVTIGGRATGTPLADTTFAGTAFALLGGGTSIAAEPTSGATHYLPIGVSGGPYSWIVGDPTSSSSTSTLFAGAIGATSVSSIVVSGGVATVAAIPLPAAAVAKPVIVLANAPEMRRWLLVPVATGLVSVALHDGSLTATTLVSNLTAAGQIAASIGFLGSTTNIRVALVDTSGTDSSVLKLYAFDVVKNTIVHEQDSVVLPFSPTRLAVPGVAMGSFASTPLDQDEFPVVMLGGAGQLARTFRTHSSTTAPISNHTLFGLSYEGIVPSPLRPEMYAYTDDGVVVGFDPLSFVARFQENISTGVSLGALSVSPDGNSLFFANAFAVFNPNDPQAPPTYDSMWIFNP